MTSKYINQKLLKLKREINSVILGNITTSLLVISRRSKMKSRNDTEGTL
jgi:hypothetical protein